MRDGIDGRQVRMSFGYVFYFFDDPGQHRERLVRAVESFGDCFRATFTRVRHDTAHFRTFKGSWLERVRDFLASSDFSNAHTLTLTDGSKEKVQTQKVLLALHRIEEWFPKKIPSLIYVEVPESIDADLRWNAIENAFMAMSFHLGFGNRVVAINDEAMPGAAARAVRLLADSGGDSSELSSAWANLSYLEQSRMCLEEVNEYTGLGPKLRTLAPASSAPEYGHVAMGEDYILLRCGTSDQRNEMRGRLKSALCDIAKPREFWKPEQWQRWRSARRRG